MEMNERLVYEMIKELQEMNDRLKETLHSFQRIEARLEDFRQLHRQQNETFSDIFAYLKDYQRVADYQLEHPDRQTSIDFNNLKSLFALPHKIFADPLSRASALNNVPISSSDKPVYTNDKSFLQYLAEQTFTETTTTSRLYYRVGFLNNVSTTVYQYLDEGFTTEPANVVPAGMLLRVVSTSANDSAAGTGAQRVLISGIDATGSRANETVIMNGTTGVTTVTTWKWLDFFCIIAVGTYNGTAVGTISLTNTAATTTFAQIAAGRRSWRSGKIHVPTVGRGYLHQWAIGSFKSDVSFELLVSPTSDKNTIIARSATNSTGQSTNILFPAPIYIPSDGRVVVDALANGTVNQADTSFSCHISPT